MNSGYYSTGGTNYLSSLQYYMSDGLYSFSTILVLLAFIAAIVASIRVKSTYRKYDKIESRRRITAEQAVAAVLHYYNVQGVQIQHISGNLTDNYNPSTNIISLSDSVYGRSSIAAIGVACHEAGHAAQHAEGYKPIKIRNAIIPICNIGSNLGIPLALVGFFLSIDSLVLIGLLLYSLIAVFQFITLPVELDASHRALKVIRETGLLEEEEQKGAYRVLKAAAMTYVVALATVLANLLRYIAIFTRKRD